MSVAYIVTIEGIGQVVSGTAEQTRYCYADNPGGVPDYASGLAHYVPGLARAPTGVSAAWDLVKQTVTVGRYSLVLRDGVGPVRFYRTRPHPLTELRTAVNASATSFTMAEPSGTGDTGSGIVSDSIYYMGRETVKSGTITPVTNNVVPVTRGVCGSTAEGHAVGADMYDGPPVLVGRKVTVYEVPVDAASAASEVVILRGYVAVEPAAGIHSVTLEVHDRLRGELGGIGDLNAYVAWYENDVLPADVIIGVDQQDGTTPQPIVNAGGYWYFPDAEMVLPAAWSGSRWNVDTTRLVWPEDDTELERESHSQPARQVLLSDADLPYPPFDDGAGAVSDHPCDIARCLLTTFDGANGAFDVQTSRAALYPNFALGVDSAAVDNAAFIRARNHLGGVRARRLWLNATVEPDTIDEVFHQLFGPLGWAVGTRRDGSWTIIRLADVYPSDTVVTLDGAAAGRTLIRPGQWRHTTWGRPLDRLLIKTDPGPEDEGTKNAVVREEELLALYRENVGGAEKWERTPYTFDQWYPSTSVAAGHAVRRVARLAQRLAVLTVWVGPSTIGSVDVGTQVLIKDTAIRDPQTGLKYAVGGVGFYGVVTSVRTDWDRRIAECTVVLTDTPDKVAHYCAAATVSSVLGAVYDVESRDYTSADGPFGSDATAFRVGDKVRLCDSRLVERSGGVRTVDATADGPPAKLTLDSAFSVSANAGDTIVYGGFLDHSAIQLAENASSSEGGSTGAEVGLDGLGSPPYVWGDA